MWRRLSSACGECGVLFNLLPGFNQDQLGILTVPGTAIRVAVQGSGRQRAQRDRRLMRVVRRSSSPTKRVVSKADWRCRCRVLLQQIANRRDANTDANGGSSDLGYRRTTALSASLWPPVPGASRSLRPRFTETW